MSSKSPKAKQRSEPKSKDSAIVKPVAENGLPPGISPQRAKDPGNAPGSKRVKNNS